MKRIGDLDVLRQLSTRRGTSAVNMPPSSGDDDSCPICKGAGFLRVDAPVGSPNFGRLIPCECKIAEREERRHREIAEMSSLGAFEGQTFETFDPDVPGVREAYEAALAYAENPDGWLFLLGGYGCGKTHLAAAVAHYVIAHQRMRALFLVVPDLLDHLRATFAPDQGATYDARFNAIRTIDLLVLDDLGTEHTTPWAREKLFQIINFRYNERRPTIITSNRNFDELDPRVASRLSDPRICHAVLIPAGDYRVRRASALRRFPGR
nr:MAG: ATP-binding protein [Sphaerobacter thermophilus]